MFTTQGACIFEHIKNGLRQYFESVVIKCVRCFLSYCCLKVPRDLLEFKSFKTPCKLQFFKIKVVFLQKVLILNKCLLGGVCKSGKCINSAF